MTFTDCTVTLVGLTDLEDPANPEPFRDLLPRSRSGHYWGVEVTQFAKARGLEINWVIDNGTPEIVVTAEQLKELLLDAYGEEDAYFQTTLPYLGADQQYRVYADDF